MPSPGGDATFLKDLNDAQRAAVLHDSGPLAVLAGPGTGKTRVIVHRVARAVAPVNKGGLGAKPESVLALAFTIKSAEELRNRLAGMFGKMGLPAGYAERVRAGTVHSFGSSIVRRFADRLNLPSNLTVMDSAQQRRVLRDLIWSNDLFKHLAAQGRETAVEGAMRFIAACRNDAVTPQRAADWIKRRRDLISRGVDPETNEPFVDAERGKRLLADQPTHEDHAALLALYDQRCASEGAITLDDFISLPAKLLREDAGVAAILRDEHRHIVVDEFQDWNVAQIELLTLLAPATREDARPSDVCVVGDDDQSIYAFRGADDRAFERFAKHYPNYTRVALTQNYRSARVIIETANEIIAKAGARFAPDKTIEPGDPDNAKFATSRIEGVTTAKGESDGAAIAAMILLDRAENESREWSDYAVIARSQSHLDQIGAELDMQGIPVAVRDGVGALEDEFVEDLRAWEEAIADPLCAAGGSPRRILWRAPIGMRIEDIQRYEREHASMQRDNEEPRPYLEWLVAAHAGDPKVARFREVYDKCRAIAAEHNADVALEHIARETVLPVFDALDQDDRLRSGLWLVKYLAFVRDKQQNLPAPGDLQAWRAYWDDLDEKERSRLALGGAERVERTGSDDEDTNNAVQLITAHSAKGLEFDTVFLPRVRPGIGMYPSSLSGDDDALAPDLAARKGTGAGDEERRLFYVACTRAERRLVLLAKEKKGKSEGKFGDYFLELTEFADPATRVPVADAAQWIERAGAHMHTPSDALDGESGGALDRLLRDARRDAASLLFAAQSSETGKDALLKIEHDLAHLARRIAVLGRLRAGGVADLPAFLRDAANNDARLKKFIEQASTGSGVITLAPRKPPLKLSYSTITDFEMCGLCFYVKYILGLDEPKTAALAVGGVAHLALERFYKERRAAEADGRFPPGRERLLELGAVEFERQAPRDAQGRREMRERITGMLEHAYDDLHNDADEVLETELNIRMRFRLPDEPDDAPAHQFIAKIDRVDRTPSGGFRVVDYKTGVATKSKLEIPKTDLQMSLYALALSVWLNADMPENGEAFDAVRLDRIEPIEGEAQYWVLSTGERGSIPFSSLNLEKAAEKVHAAARAMLDGKYEKGKQCKGLCAYIGR